MWSGRPISGPRNPHLEQGRGVGVGGAHALGVVPAAALLSSPHQSLCAEQEGAMPPLAAALARRLFH